MTSRHLLTFYPLPIPQYVTFYVRPDKYKVTIHQSLCPEQSEMFSLTSKYLSNFLF